MPAWASGITKALEERQAPGVPLPPPSPEYLAYSAADEILSITGAFFAVAAIVVLLRCYVRMGMLKVFGIDDWVMLFAMALTAATFACFVLEVQNGLGKHFMILMSNPILYSKFSQLLYIHALLVMVGISSVKISIAFFLLRLSQKTPYSRFLYGVIAFIIVLTLACAMTLIFQCLPVEAAWDYSLRPPPFGKGDAQCYSMTTFRNLGLMNSSFNIITDVLFATLPVPLIWQLQLNMRTKISLIAILSLGYFACAAAIVKAILQWNVLSDPDWTVHDSFNVWNFIELTVGAIAASLPSLKPLFNWCLETARAFTTGSRTKNSDYGKNSGYHNAESLGYHKESYFSSKSVALQSITSGGGSNASSYGKDPYRVRISTRPSPTSVVSWDAQMHQAKKSDDSISPLHHPQEGPMRIMVSREVTVD